MEATSNNKKPNKFSHHEFSEQTLLRFAKYIQSMNTTYKLLPSTLDEMAAIIHKEGIAIKKRLKK